MVAAASLLEPRAPSLFLTRVLLSTNAVKQAFATPGRPSGIRPKREDTMATATISDDAAASTYDRATAVREFDESKVGVKGLVDSGIITIPSFFHHQDLDVAATTTPSSLSIPTIDLSLPRPEVVSLVRDACRNWGFFLAVNHGIPLETISSTIEAVRAFNELATPVKSAYYSRTEMEATGVNFNTNYDLHRSKAAQWRDTLVIRMAPQRPVEEKIPETCRAEVLAWDEQLREVCGRIMGILSEGLGAPPEKLEKMSFLDGRLMACHYYPPCPQPDFTLGIASHRDASLLTVVVQDHIGGLQVEQTSAGDGARWIDVPPIPGALVINVGDLLQIISNDEYRSVEHRVVANRHSEARVSIAVFFNPGMDGTTDYYEPLPEIVAQGKPLLFRKLTVPESMRLFYSKELSSGGIADHFRI